LEDRAMKRQSILVVAMIVCMVAPQVMATLEFNDGGQHTIDYAISDLLVTVDKATPDAGTMVDLVDGGSLFNLWSYGQSIVNISGGTVEQYLRIYENSTATISGGSVTLVISYNTSRVAVSGGFITDNLDVQDDSTVTVDGATIDNMYASGDSDVTIYGGTFDSYISVHDNSRVSILGGSIGTHLVSEGQSQITFSGGTIGTVIRTGHFSNPIWDTSVITFEGTGFAINGMGVGYGQYFASDYSAGILTGTLANGDALDNIFYIYDGASIVLVPEPTTLLLLGLGAVIVTRKRQPCS
jgi:hypothetical protein